MCIYISDIYIYVCIQPCKNARHKSMRIFCLSHNPTVMEYTHTSYADARLQTITAIIKRLRQSTIPSSQARDLHQALANNSQR